MISEPNLNNINVNILNYIFYEKNILNTSFIPLGFNFSSHAQNLPMIRYFLSQIEKISYNEHAKNIDIQHALENLFLKNGNNKDCLEFLLPLNKRIMDLSFFNHIYDKYGDDYFCDLIEKKIITLCSKNENLFLMPQSEKLFIHLFIHREYDCDKEELFIITKHPLISNIYQKKTLNHNLEKKTIINNMQKQNLKKI